MFSPILLTNAGGWNPSNRKDAKSLKAALGAGALFHLLLFVSSLETIGQKSNLNACYQRTWVTSTMLFISWKQGVLILKALLSAYPAWVLNADAINAVDVCILISLKNKTIYFGKTENVYSWG